MCWREEKSARRSVFFDKRRCEKRDEILGFVQKKGGTVKFFPCSLPCIYVIQKIRYARARLTVFFICRKIRAAFSKISAFPEGWELFGHRQRAHRVGKTHGFLEIHSVGKTSRPSAVEAVLRRRIGQRQGTAAFADCGNVFLAKIERYHDHATQAIPV